MRVIHAEGAAVKVVFAVDAIFAPLTGIGRYAHEIAIRLPLVADIESVQYLGMWGWMPTAGGSTQDSRPETSFQMNPVLAKLRRSMSKNILAVELYDKVAENWRKRLLRRARGAIFHSPNYFVPEHDGPTVATVHDLSIYRFPEMHPKASRRYFDLSFERSLKRADALITDSETVRQEIISDFSVPAERITAIHLGVDASFRPYSNPEVSDVLERYRLCYGGFMLAVATLEPRKKLDNLIEAYGLLPANVKKKYPLVIVGSAGWLNERAQKRIVQGQTQGWLRYLGYVPQADLPRIYAAARGFAMISIYEGFGLPVLEAMASGVPVLTSNCSCLPEVAGGAALLANPLDVEQVKVQMEILLTDDVWRYAAVVRGLRRANELTWEMCMQRTATVYRSLMSPVCNAQK